MCWLIDRCSRAHAPPYKQGTGVAWGAEDWLMSFLGVVILSFGFKIFGQRRLMRGF